MKVKSLIIENFKSIERIELIEPNPFTVFVGPNGSGKSNIFEALEFVNIKRKNSEFLRLFGGFHKVLKNHRSDNSNYSIRVTAEFNDYTSFDTVGFLSKTPVNIYEPEWPYLIGSASTEALNLPDYKQFYNNFLRLFIGSKDPLKEPFRDADKLTLSGNNLEVVLKRLLANPAIEEELFEWLTLFIPSFKSVEIHSDSISDTNSLLVHEQYSERPFTRDLISDGTYNILALLTAVYQSDEPQFLCIEEPENGLNPEVVKELVQFFRYKCKEKGHYIWLNTHSQTLVSQLTADEIVVVDKVKGATQTKQFKGHDFHGLRMDEAWLMNVLGGGLPW